MSRIIAVTIVIALLGLPAAAAPPSGQVVSQEEQGKITPAQALTRLKEGNARFVAGTMRSRDLAAQVKATAGGQYPYAMVLGCVDSRVPVEVMFDQGIGDVFASRVAGNFVTDEMLGSIEFATKVAGAKLVVVLGHTGCGAVKGACDDVQLGHIRDLVEEIRPSVMAVVPKGQTCSSKNATLVDEIASHNVRRNVAEMRMRSKILRDMEDNDEILIVGGMYDLATGKVEFFEDTRTPSK